MKNIKHAVLGTLALLTTAGLAWASVPNQIAFQGRISVDGVNFDGAGEFKFAIVNADGTKSYWSNDGTSVEGEAPDGSVTLSVHRGLYAVLLGGPGMEAIDTSVFAYVEGASLRVWFDDGTHGFQHLSPDQLFASVPFAHVAGVAAMAEVAESANSLSADYKLDVGNFSEELQAILAGVAGVGETLASQQERLDHLSAWQDSFAPVISVDTSTIIVLGDAVEDLEGTAVSRTFSVTPSEHLSVSVSFSTDFDWLTYDSETWTITADPPQEAVGVTVTATISATNLAGTTTASFSISVVAKPTEVPVVSAGADRVVFTDESVEFNVTATNGPIETFELDANDAGATIDGVTGKVTIDASGAAPGVYTLSFTATNAAGVSEPATILVRVAVRPDAIPVVTIPDPENMVNRNLALVVDQEMDDLVISASNGPIISFNYSGSTPAGLTFSGPDFESDTFTISGTPTELTNGTRIAGGVTATNVKGISGNPALIIWVVDEPLIQNTRGDAGFAFSVMETDSMEYQIVASHPQGDPNTESRPAPTHSDYRTSESAPAWISIDTNGKLSGTAPAAFDSEEAENNTFTFDVEVENAAGWSVAQEFSVTLLPLQEVTELPVPAGGVAGNINVPFSFQIEANNVPTGYDAIGLPAGLELDIDTGEIHGTPTAEGSFIVQIGARNAANEEGEFTYTNLIITINPPAPQITSPLFWSSHADNAAANYYQIKASPVTVPYGDGVIPSPGLAYGAVLKGGDSLPAGLQVNATTGVLSATGYGPATGTIDLTISVTTDFGSDSQTLRLTLFR